MKNSLCYDFDFFLIYLLKPRFSSSHRKNLKISRNTSKFPVHAEIARDVLAIPLISVASESAFSTGGRIIDRFRSSLASKTVEALICCQNWLRSSPNFEHGLHGIGESLLPDIEDEESYKLESGNIC
jgi:hypothetical protein